MNIDDLIHLVGLKQIQLEVAQRQISTLQQQLKEKEEKTSGIDQSSDHPSC